MAKLVTLGWDSLFDDAGATITESGAASGFPSANGSDWLTWTSWKAGGSGAWRRASFASARTCSYFAIAVHDLGTLTGTMTLDSSPDGTTWTTRATLAPSDDRPRFVLFAPVAALHWRVTLSAGASVGVVAAGPYLTIPNGQWVGETPHDLARDHEALTTISEAGHFLGRSLIRRGYSVSVTGEYLEPDWVTDYWLPFMIHAEVKPFFVVWPTPAANTPARCLYCWLPGMPPRPQITAPREMAVKFSARGIG
jgi:hypothetical protein